MSERALSVCYSLIRCDGHSLLANSNGALFGFSQFLTVVVVEAICSDGNGSVVKRRRRRCRCGHRRPSIVIGLVDCVIDWFVFHCDCGVFYWDVVLSEEVREYISYESVRCE